MSQKHTENEIVLGTLENPVMDSSFSWAEAVLKNLDVRCPAEIIEQQTVLSVRYLSFDSRVHQGQLVLDERLAREAEDFFKLMLTLNFPVEKVVPMAHPDFLKAGRWDDVLSMSADNTSAFNYRPIAGTNKLSLHAYGWALDINPRLNPYVRAGGVTEPPNAVYAPDKPGVLTLDSPIIQEALRRGWVWGGTWTNPDYQHLQRSL